MGVRRNRERWLRLWIDVNGDTQTETMDSGICPCRHCWCGRDEALQAMATFNSAWRQIESKLQASEGTAEDRSIAVQRSEPSDSSVSLFSAPSTFPNLASQPQDQQVPSGSSENSQRSVEHVPQVPALPRQSIADDHRKSAEIPMASTAQTSSAGPLTTMRDAETQQFLTSLEASMNNNRELDSSLESPGTSLNLLVGNVFPVPETSQTVVKAEVEAVTMLVESELQQITSDSDGQSAAAIPQVDKQNDLVVDSTNLHDAETPGRPLTFHKRKLFEPIETCNTCGKAFADAANLARHKKVHKDQEPYQPLAPSGGGGLSELVDLIAEDTEDSSSDSDEDENGRFKCDKCGKTFDSRHSMERHMVTHTGKGAFKCDKCPKSYLYKSDLQKHSKSHKPGAGESRHVCQYCKRKYTNLDNLKQHVKVHVRSAERPFECTQCQRFYSKYKHLHSHQKTHEVRKNRHTCDKCHKEFKQASHVIRHQRDNCHV